MYKKKKNKTWIFLVLLILVVATGGGAYKYQQAQAQQEAEEEEIVVLENQELIQVRITEVLGNEMTGSIITEENVQGEQKTWMIPVGTDVVTKLGTTTTFARLSSGDTIQMLMQKDGAEDECILKIWVTQ